MLSDNPLAVAQLEKEFIGWLTTINGNGQPQSSPVWHVIDGNDLVVYSRPNAAKVLSINSNPNVSYHLRGDFKGDTIVTMEGTAQVDPSLPTPLNMADYVTKYADDMVRLGWTPEEYDEEFSIPVRIVITRIRTFAP